MLKTIKRIYWYLVRHLFVSANADVKVFGNKIKKSNVNVCSNSRLIVEQGAVIDHSTILMHDGAILTIRRNAVLRNVRIDLRCSELAIGEGTKIEDSAVVAFEQATLNLGKAISAKGIEIVAENAKVEIGKNASLSDWKLIIERECSLVLGEAVVCERGNYWCCPEWSISHGSEVIIGDHNRLRNKFWVRFGARVNIGTYNCINEGTEIRADENIEIGSYNMISYLCRIWDTDTHYFYVDDTRRKMTKEMYPNIGVEKDKPIAKPITIGDDCLIGEGAIMLKGCEIGNKVKVGTRVVVSNIQIPDNSTVVGEKSVIIKG